MVRELAEGQAVVTETGFDGHLSTLPPARQIDDPRPTGKQGFLRDLVGNGTHDALSVVFAGGLTHPHGNIAGASPAWR